MASNPHVLAVTLPLQGHTNPTIQLCNRLAWKGIRVTFVMPFSCVKQFDKKQPQPEPVHNLVSIETVPDPSNIYECEDVEIFLSSFRETMTSGLSDIIARYRDSGEPLTAIIYDSCIPWALELAHEKGLKGAALFTQSAAVCVVYYHAWKGSLDISGGDVWLPGLPAMGVKELPSLVYDVGDYGVILRSLFEQFPTFDKVDWRLFNTFDGLEIEALNWIGKLGKIRTIGPTIPSMYTDKRIKGNYDYGFSFFNPETKSFIDWLDNKEDNSVIYISFGSLADLSKEQMEEVAWGLIETKCYFLWVVRETERGKLPQFLISNQTGQGLIVNWCNQLQVLSHHAVGCFFSHCGWNSTLEALALGVPMVVMPQWTDQPTNAKMIVDMWGTGVRVKADGNNGIVMREEVAARIEEVMQRERGDELRRNALKWKDLAIEALGEGGSSDHNITEFAHELISTFTNIRDKKSSDI